MARRALWVALAVVVALALWRVVPYATEDRTVIASTVAAEPIAAADPLGLPGGSEVCFAQVTFVPNGEVLHFTVSDGPEEGPPLEVRMESGGAFTARAQVPAGYRPGPVNVRVPTPDESTLGTLCIRNAGEQTIALLGSSEGRLVSRSETTVDGQTNQIKVALRFEERRTRPLVAHVPDMLRNAAALDPLPVWIVWLLALGMVFALPAVVLRMFVGAIREDEATAPRAAGASAPPDPRASAPPDPRASAPPLPLARPRAAVARGWRRGIELARGIEPRVLFIAVLAVGFLYLAYQATRVRGFQNDENEYVYLARWTVNNFPESLWDFSTMTRGLQRLEVWLLALPLSLFKQPLAFNVAHVLNVAAYVSAAVPGYLLARGLGLAPRWRVLAALLTIALPWAVIAVTFLTEPLAYPAFTWALWAIWRAAVFGGWRADVVAIAVIGIATLSRTALGLLGPLLVATVLWQELRFGDWRGEDGWRSRGRAFVVDLVRRHPVLMGGIAAGAAYYGLGRLGVLPLPTSLTGAYGTPFFGISSAFLDKTAFYLARLTAGVGFFPFVIAVPWLLVRLVKPGDARLHAFAVVSFVAWLLVLYVNSPAGTDERYVVYLAPPLMIGFAAALARRDLRWPYVVAGGVAAIWLMHKFGWNAAGGAYGFFIGPAESFYARVFLFRLQADFVSNPGPVMFVIQMGAVAFAAWLFTRHRHVGRAIVGLALAVALVQVVQTHYNAGRFVTQAMGQEPPQAQRAWIDQAIHGKGRAAIWADGPGNSTAYDPVWREAEYWNNSLTDVVSTEFVGIQIPRDDVTREVEIDPDTGVIVPQNGLPDYAVVPADGRSVVVGRTIAKAGYIPAELIEVDRPWRKPWAIGEFERDGYLGPGKTGAIRVFAGAAPEGTTNPCLAVDVLPPHGFKGSVRLASRRAADEIDVANERLGRVTIPLEELRRGAGSELLRLEVEGAPVPLLDGREATIQLAGLRIDGC